MPDTNGSVEGQDLDTPYIITAITRRELLEDITDERKRQIILGLSPEMMQKVARKIEEFLVYNAEISYSTGLVLGRLFGDDPTLKYDVEWQEDEED